jgi:hypothetical protein
MYALIQTCKYKYKRFVLFFHYNVAIIYQTLLNSRVRFFLNDNDNLGNIQFFLRAILIDRKSQLVNFELNIIRLIQCILIFKKSTRV